MVTMFFGKLYAFHRCMGVTDYMLWNRVNFFVSTATLGKIPTLDNFRKRGIIVAKW